MIYYFGQIFSIERNLGKTYNAHISLIGDDDTAILTDGDTCFLTPDYGMLIAEYVAKYPDAVLTCWTNRINEKAEQQYPNIDRSNDEMSLHINKAIELQQAPVPDVTPLHGFVSGFCLVVPKKIWNNTKFPEKQMFEDRGPHNLLGVDNWWTNTIRAKGVPVLRMNRLYIWHTYRLLTNSNAHLL